MSKFVGKTFESLNSIFNNSGLFQSGQSKPSSKYQLPWLADSKSVIRKLKTLESEQEKEEVIKSYLSEAEKRLAEPDIAAEEIEDIINMCMICETMGFPTPFIYIHCLKLAQKGNLQQKRTGFTAVAYLLNPKHELVVLLINTIQKDLLSSNYLEVLLALTAVCNLINVETVHDVLHLVEDKLNHPKSSVRKSAILTLGHCLQLIDSASAYQMSFSKFEKALTDSDLEVVSAAICVLYKIVQVLSGDYSYLIDSLVELQNQILLRRVPRSMTYCDIPAPWLQIDILKLLKYLQKTSEQSQVIVPMLKKTLQQITLQSTLAHAILYQVIDTISCIESPNDLVEMALASVSTLLKSRNINLKLIGVEALILVVKSLKPSIAAAQQEIIMECLKLPDETLQHKTLELLYHLANPFNVQAICKKMLDFLISATTDAKKKELSLKIIKLAKAYSDRKEWYITVNILVLNETGSVLSSTDVYDIINHISQDTVLRELAKKCCLDLYKRKEKLSYELIKLYVSILNSTSEFEEVLPYLVPISDESAMTWIFISLTDTLMKSKEITPDFTTFLKSLDINFYSAQQALKQLLLIIDTLPTFKEYDVNEKVDPSLTFLDNFLVLSLEESGFCYQPLSYRSNSISMDESQHISKVDITSSFSDVSIAQESVNSQSQISGTYNAISSPSTSFQSMSGSRNLSFQVPKALKNLWTEEGRKNKSITKTLSVEDVETDSIQTEKGKEDFSELFAGVS
uniref:AP-4 complex subunit epsilon n=1 Tax=Parasteatoda tepidariorum TaxID=114398 RepID=A0A2L2YGF0_PARTP